MVAVQSEEHPRYFLQSLRSYTFDPLSTATNLVEREHSEIADERDAFRALQNRVAEIEPAQSSTSPTPSTTLAEHNPTSTKMDQVCTAYRETVMAVPHYDEVYGEPLLEHLARELGPELATRVDQTGGAYSSSFKAVLQAKLEHAIHSREQLLTTLAEEAQSINEAQTALVALFEQLDTTIIPGWYSEDFTSELETIAEERQETLRNRTSEPYLDEHSLCTYLYGEQSWTYPILTAVARMREVVTVDTHHESSVATGN